LGGERKRDREKNRGEGEKRGEGKKRGRKKGVACRRRGKASVQERIESARKGGRVRERIQQ
jgi:hypothetical protein